MVNKNSPESPNASTRRTLFELSRKMLLAGIGAAVLAQEEMESFVNRLVQKGELAENDARRLIKEVMDRREKMAQEKAAQVHPPAAATKADIDALAAKIAELNKKIEELTKTEKK